MMSHFDPVDGSDRRPDFLPIQTPPLEIRNIGPGAEEITSRVNAQNGIASLAWILFLIALASAVPVTVLLWRAAFWS
jgi:hypothetical protein